MTRYFHKEDCRCGKKAALTKSDEWWINAPQYNNCFWTYLRHNNRQHTLFEIAKLLRLSISAITSIEKKAFSKVRNRIKLLNIEK